MPERQNPEKHQIEISGGYVSKRDELKHRIATLSVFGPVVAVGGVVILVVELAAGGGGIGLIVSAVGIGMIVWAKLLQAVLNRW